MPGDAIHAVTSRVDYELRGAEALLTPALLIYSDIVELNVEALLRLAGGDPGRLRPHVKTAKLAASVRHLLERRIRTFKCATTLELKMLCELGAPDVLLAYPVVGASAARVRQLAERFPRTRVSVLVESPAHVAVWHRASVGLFIDVDPGMHRTGIDARHAEVVVALAAAIRAAGLELRGLHYYDGHRLEADLGQRERRAHRGYDRLLGLVERLETSGAPVDELVTSGTPAALAALSYRGFVGGAAVHRASPGTLIYGDCTSAAQIPASRGFRPAALVLATVVSHPTHDLLTCDAGHKTVSADAGIPTCVVLGRRDLTAAVPSEEHLPIRVASGAARPAIGSTLLLVPRHVCPTVNNFDFAVIVKAGRVSAIERVTARGRECPVGDVGP